MFEQWSDVESLIKKSTPSAQLIQDIDDALELLKFLILHIFGEGYSLATQGSFEQDLITPLSDIDVVINDNAEPLLGTRRQIVVLEMLDTQLRELRGSDPDIEKIRVCKRILKARVPIIRLVFRDRLFIDVSAGDKMRGRPDRVVRNLVSHGVGSKLLCRAIKVWATTHRLNDTHMGGLSSFSWVLLCICYLQTKCGMPAFRSMEVWGSESENPARLKSLVTGFFAWLEVEFTGTRTCKSIDVMTATMTELMEAHPLQIIVPTQPEENAARCLRADKWWHKILPMIRRTRQHVVNNKIDPVKKVMTKKEIARAKKLAAPATKDTAPAKNEIALTRGKDGPPYICVCDSTFRKLRAFVRHRKICSRRARAHMTEYVVIGDDSSISVASSGTLSSSDNEHAATGLDQPSAKRRCANQSAFANNPWQALMQENDDLAALSVANSSNDAAPFSRDAYASELATTELWSNVNLSRGTKMAICEKGDTVTGSGQRAGVHVTMNWRKEKAHSDARQAAVAGGKNKKKKKKGPRDYWLKKNGIENQSNDALQAAAGGNKKKRRRNRGTKNSGTKKNDKSQNAGNDAPQAAASGKKNKKKKKKGPKGSEVKKKDKTHQSNRHRMKVKQE